MSIEYTYNVTPFHPVVTRKTASAPEQLSGILNEAAKAGWEFYRLDHYTETRPPGCLGGLIGQGPTFVSHDVIVFRRPAA